jgi:hypothetical protein
MSSTSNAQDLLVNVFRPTYRWDAGTGFTPSLVVSNVTELISGTIKTDKLAVSDSNGNTYIGSNAGPLLNVTTTASNTAIGYNAMAGASSSSNNVSIGTSNFAGLTNATSNVGLGANTRITGSGQKNIMVGANLSLGTGSGNIVIGNDLSLGNISNTFRLGSLLYGDLSQGYIGINTPSPQAPLDISGIVLFRNKVGFQNPNPVYSLDVAGSIYASERYLAGRGTLAAPIFAFVDVSGTGFYQPTDASYGVGAIGLAVGSSLRGVVMSNKTILYGGLDVCGTVTSSGGSASFLAGPGSVSEPAYSFSGSSNLGMYRTTDASGTAVSIAIGGSSRLVVGSNKVTILGNFDVCGAFSAASGGGGGGGSGTIAANGSANAPSFTFANDLSTGMHLVKTSTMAFDTSGVQRMCISGGFVGIGTPTPLYPLDVSGTTTTSNLIVPVYIRDALIPSQFDISGGNISNSLTSTSSNLRVAVGSVSAPTVAFTSSTNTGLYASATGHLDVATGGFRCMNLNAGGVTTYLGLRAAGTSPQLFINATTGLNNMISFNSTAAGALAIGNQVAGLPDGQFGVSTDAGATASFRVATSGIVVPGHIRDALIPSTLDISGGNISNSGRLLTGSGTISAPSYTFGADPSMGVYRPGASQLAFATAGIQRMTLSNGNVGIGTPSPAFTLDVSGNANIQAANGTGAFYVGGSSTGVIIQRDIGGNGYIRALSSGVNLYLGTSNVNTLTILSTGLVGLGTTAPSYALDVSAAAGTPSLNLSTWPRIPLSNAVLAKGVANTNTIVGNTLNINTVVRTINSALATFVASNATSGGSLLINKAGIWSIMLVGSTGNGTQLWMDVSTNNHSNITQYTNGNPVLSIAYTPGSGTSNNTTCTFMGFLPSNVYVKPRLNGSLGGDADVVWRFNAIFHAETDAVSTWPF